jgi:hypothetical protein
MAQIKVASTGTEPELVDRVKIVRAARPGQGRSVVLSLGPGAKTDLPLPSELQPDDLLRVFVELEVTTDYEKKVKGSIGTPYPYAPRLEAVLLLASDANATARAAGRAHSIAKTPLVELSHERHHELITLAAEYRVPAGGPPFSGAPFVNVALGAAHPDARRGNVVLVGENEPDPVVGQDTAGIRVLRLRPGDQPAVASVREQRLRRRAGVPVTRTPTVIYSRELKGLAEGEQLFVHGRLITDAKRTGYPTRITTRLFLADGPRQAEPGGHAKDVATWGGHLSKPNGCNCLPGRGAQRTEKFGVVRLRRDATQPLYVNLVAVSTAPFETPPETGDDLPVESGSFVEIVRYPSELEG